MWEGRRILVVDDDEVVGRSIHRVLEQKGYKVREAMSGQEALDEFDHQAYDLVFTDIRMPGMDGLEVASRLKKAHPEVPVVIVTGYGSEANERRAAAAGVAGFLRKPLTPEMIIDHAERALKERQETLEAIRASAVALASRTAVAAPEAAPAAGRVPVAKNVALFLAAPFIGLAYIVAFPFVGVWALGKLLVARR